MQVMMIITRSMRVGMENKKITGGLMDKVFVYGSLRVGGRLHHSIQKFIKTVEKGYIVGAQMYDCNGGGYPHISLDGNHCVHGDLITFKKHCCKEAFRIMNVFESQSYEPAEVTVHISNDRCETAIIYATKPRIIKHYSEMEDFESMKVRGGDWFKYLKIKEKKRQRRFNRRRLGEQFNT